MANNIATTTIGINQGHLANQVTQGIQAGQRAAGPLRLNLQVSGGNNLRSLSQPLGRITGDLTQFQSSLDASVARVLAFGASASVMAGVGTAMRKLVEVGIEVEKTLTDINVVFQLSQSELSKFSSGMFEVARSTAKSFTEVGAAAVELARQGLSSTETLTRLKDAMILSRLSGMDSAAAVQTLTATINGFQREVLTTTDIVNRMASVDMAFAVSTNDLSNALARSGAVAQEAGVKFNELIAAVTAVQQTTARGGSVIGNGLKTIFTRLQREDTLEKLEELGVRTREASGEFRGAMAILQDYARVYGTLSDAQQSSSAETVAGVFQINTLKALIRDLNGEYSIYSRALDKANSSTDEAATKNEALNQTLSALISRTGTSLTQVGSGLFDRLLGSGGGGVGKVLGAIDLIASKFAEMIDPEKGNAVAKAFVDGIGNFIAGPGLAIIGSTVFKLVRYLATEAGQAFKQIALIGTKKQEQLTTEQAILQVLERNGPAMNKILALSGNRAAQEAEILKVIQAQNNALNAQNSIKKAVSMAIIPLGAVGKPGGVIKTKAAGFIPNFALDEFALEEAHARSLGAPIGVQAKYSKGTIDGRRFVMNNHEVEIPGIGRNGDSMVLPRYASGFVPNFAKAKQNIDEPVRLTADTWKAEMLIPFIKGRQEFDNVYTRYPKKGGQAYYVDNIVAHGFDQRQVDGISDDSVDTANSASKLEREIKDTSFQTASNWLNTHIKPRIGRKISQQDLASAEGGEQKGLKGAIRSFVGSIFEATILASLRQGAVATPFAAGDFDIRGGSEDLNRLFNSRQSYTLKDFKVSTSPGNLQSFAAKIAKETNFRSTNPDAARALDKQTEKSAGPGRKPSSRRATSKYDKSKGIMAGKAAGFLPNFAKSISQVMDIEEKMSGQDATLHTFPFLHVRNRSQPTFASAMSDHGGLNRALEDSARSQMATGFVPNFAAAQQRIDPTLIPTVRELSAVLRSLGIDTKSIKMGVLKNEVNSQIKMYQANQKTSGGLFKSLMDTGKALQFTEKQVKAFARAMAKTQPFLGTGRAGAAGVSNAGRPPQGFGNLSPFGPPPSNGPDNPPNGRWSQVGMGLMMGGYTLSSLMEQQGGAMGAAGRGMGAGLQAGGILSMMGLSGGKAGGIGVGLAIGVALAAMADKGPEAQKALELFNAEMENNIKSSQDYSQSVAALNEAVERGDPQEKISKLREDKNKALSNLKGDSDLMTDVAKAGNNLESLGTAIAKFTDRMREEQEKLEMDAAVKTAQSWRSGAVRDIDGMLAIARKTGDFKSVREASGGVSNLEIGLDALSTEGNGLARIIAGGLTLGLSELGIFLKDNQKEKRAENDKEITRQADIYALTQAAKNINSNKIAPLEAGLEKTFSDVNAAMTKQGQGFTGLTASKSKDEKNKADTYKNFIADPALSLMKASGDRGYISAYQYEKTAAQVGQVQQKFENNQANLDIVAPLGEVLKGFSFDNKEEGGVKSTLTDGTSAALISVKGELAQMIKDGNLSAKDMKAKVTEAIGLMALGKGGAESEQAAKLQEISNKLQDQITIEENQLIYSKLTAANLLQAANQQQLSATKDAGLFGEDAQKSVTAIRESMRNLFNRTGGDVAKEASSLQNVMKLLNSIGGPNNAVTGMLNERKDQVQLSDNMDNIINSLGLSNSAKASGYKIGGDGKENSAAISRMVEEIFRKVASSGEMSSVLKGGITEGNQGRWAQIAGAMDLKNIIETNNKNEQRRARTGEYASSLFDKSKKGVGDFSDAYNLANKKSAGAQSLGNMMDAIRASGISGERKEKMDAELLKLRIGARFSGGSLETGAGVEEAVMSGKVDSESLRKILMEFMQPETTTDFWLEKIANATEAMKTSLGSAKSGDTTVSFTLDTLAISNAIVGKIEQVNAAMQPFFTQLKNLEKEISLLKSQAPVDR
jgi:TP901 family phage tail tape measure protein